MDGFHVLTDPELRLIEEIGQMAEVTLAMADDDLTEAMRAALFLRGFDEDRAEESRPMAVRALFKASSIEREVEEIARRILEQAAGRPFREIGVIVRAAQVYAEALAPGGCFAHDCPPVPSQRDRIAQAGYGGWQRIGENIAAGDRTAESVVAGWLDSPGHRANILKPEYREIGVGVATGEGKYRIYWVQVFATPWE